VLELVLGADGELEVRGKVLGNLQDTVSPVVGSWMEKGTFK